MSLKYEVLKARIRKILGVNSDWSADTRTKARREWAKAFVFYLKDFECTVPAGTTDPSKTPNVSKCEGAFFNTIQLQYSNTAMKAAIEFSQAWFDSMNAMVLEPGGDYAGNPINTILTITPLAPFIAIQKPILKTTLYSIYTSGQYSTNEDEQITKISRAFHVATLASGGPTPCTYKIVNLPQVENGMLTYT